MKISFSKKNPICRLNKRQGVALTASRLENIRLYHPFFWIPASVQYYQRRRRIHNNSPCRTPRRLLFFRLSGTIQRKANDEARHILYCTYSLCCWGKDSKLHQLWKLLVYCQWRLSADAGWHLHRVGLNSEPFRSGDLQASKRAYYHARSQWWKM